MRAALILASVAALAACNFSADAQEREGQPGTGKMTQRDYSLAGFDSVGLAGPHDVVVSVGPAHSVRAEGEAEVLDRLEIRVENGNLEIGTKRQDRQFNWFSNERRAKTTIYVTMPAIQAAAIAGSGDMRIDKIEGARFAGSIGGSGDLAIASLRVGDAKFSVAGSGNISATGTAARSDISIAGSGDVDLRQVEMRNASVSIVGSGGVRAKAMDTANVSIMGSGDVHINGSAKCSISKMGSGDVRCGA